MLYCATISTRIYQAYCKSITSPFLVILSEDNTTQADNNKLNIVKQIAIRTNLFFRTANSPFLIPCLL